MASNEPILASARLQSALLWRIDPRSSDVSISDIERFSQALKSNPDLLASAEKANLADTIRLSSQHGYDFTLDEIRSFIADRARNAGKPISDAELDRLAGGYGGSCFDSVNCCLHR
jgi:predicted ribosomally synthesized peptide with nif11-like leader